LSQKLFKNSFLDDTLNSTSQPIATVHLTNGVTVTRLERGVVQVTPANSAPTTKKVVISSGIHGNETAPIEIVDQLVNELLQQQWQPTQHILFIIAHVAAIKTGERYLETNLNRLFGDANYPQTLELDHAKRLKLLVNNFWDHSDISQRWHFDLHCSIRRSQYYTFAISPASDFAVRSQACMNFLAAAKIEAVLLAATASYTFSWYSAHVFGAQSATLELGQVADFNQNDLDRLVDFKMALFELLAEPTLQPQLKLKDLKYFKVHSSVYKTTTDFQFYFSKDLPNFTLFLKNECLGVDGDQEIYMPIADGRVVFPNPEVELNQRAALLVQPCTAHFENHQLAIES
jgi:succinylglutamate desuccinylase